MTDHKTIFLALKSDLKDKPVSLIAGTLYPICRREAIQEGGLSRSGVYLGFCLLHTSSRCVRRPTPVNLSSLMCKMVLILPTSEGYWEN